MCLNIRTVCFPQLFLSRVCTSTGVDVPVTSIAPLTLTCLRGVRLGDSIEEGRTAAEHCVLRGSRRIWGVVWRSSLNTPASWAPLLACPRITYFLNLDPGRGPYPPSSHGAGVGIYFFQCSPTTTSLSPHPLNSFQGPCQPGYFAFYNFF